MMNTVTKPVCIRAGMLHTVRTGFDGQDRGFCFCWFFTRWKAAWRSTARGAVGRDRLRALIEKNSERHPSARRTVKDNGGV